MSKHIHIHLDAFKEEEHPRKGGKFAPKGGGEGPKKSTPVEPSKIPELAHHQKNYNQALSEYRKGVAEGEKLLSERSKGAPDFKTPEGKRYAEETMSMRKKLLDPLEKKLNSVERAGNKAIKEHTAKTGQNVYLIGERAAGGYQMKS